MDFQVRKDGSSAFYSVTGDKGAAVLCLRLNPDNSTDVKILEAGVHVPLLKDIHSNAVGECPYVACNKCFYSHASTKEKGLLVLEWLGDNRNDKVIEEHLSQWYQRYI